MFDLGKLKGVSNISELEAMYHSGVVKKQPLKLSKSFEPTGNMIVNRNKFFDSSGKGSLFG